MSTEAPPSRPPAVPDSLTRLGYKIRQFGSLPEGFSPLAATAEQLADQNLPRRPDPHAEPTLFALWERSMTQTKTWIAPEFAEVKFAHPRVRSPQLPTVDKPPVDPPPPPDLTTPNWSGAIQLKTANPYTFVAAQWTVPDIKIDDIWDLVFGDANLWIAAEWVGIDGWYANTGDLLQAGTAVQPLLGFSGIEINVWPWWQWVPGAPVSISNVGVSPHDDVVCLICADDTMAGATIYFTNLTRGKGTRFHVTPPHGTKLVGNTVEWIVERPTDYPGWPASWWESPFYVPLPDYVDCDFDGCIAGGTGGWAIHLDGASTLTMVSHNGDILSDAQIESDDTLKVTWHKSG